MNNSPKTTNFTSVSRHLDGDFVELLLAEARHRARIPTFLEKITKSGNPPQRYQYVAPSQKKTLSQFIQNEWVGKGYTPNEIDHEMLKAYDPELVKALLESEEILPQHLSFQQKPKKKPCNLPSP